VDEDTDIMLPLTDVQLETITAKALMLDGRLRGRFVELVSRELVHKGIEIADADIRAATRSALLRMVGDEDARP
jgi:hypothetical protein